MTTGQPSSSLVTLLADRSLANDSGRWYECFWGMADFARQRASEASTIATWTPASLVIDAAGKIHERPPAGGDEVQLPPECVTTWRHPAWAEKHQNGRGDEFYSFIYLLCVLLEARRPKTQSRSSSPWWLEEDLRRPWKIALTAVEREGAEAPPIKDPILQDTILASLPARMCALREQRAEDLPTMAESAFFFDLPSFSRLSAPTPVTDNPPLATPEALTPSGPTPGRSLPPPPTTVQPERPPHGRNESTASDAASLFADTKSSKEKGGQGEAAGSVQAAGSVELGGKLKPISSPESTVAVPPQDAKAAENETWDTTPDALGLIALGPSLLTANDQGWSWRKQLTAPGRVESAATSTVPSSATVKAESQLESIESGRVFGDARASRRDLAVTPEDATTSVIDAEREQANEASEVRAEERSSSFDLKTTGIQRPTTSESTTSTSLRDVPSDQLLLHQLIILGRDEEARVRFNISELRERFALGDISMAELRLIRTWLGTHVGSLTVTGLRAASPTLVPDGPPKYRVLWEGPHPTICGRCCVALTRDLPGRTSTPESVQVARSLICSWNNGERRGFTLSDDLMDCHLAIWPCLDIGDEPSTWVYGEPLVLERTVRELLPPKKPTPPPPESPFQRLKRRLLG
ncbi:MAG: hypothetical protein U1A77_19290 [Pirellulales bacterium]